MTEQSDRSLSDLHGGDRVSVTIVSHEPWGVIAQIHGYEQVGASLDVIRRGNEPGVRRLARDRPPVGSTVELVVGELRPRHDRPGTWVDLTCNSSAVAIQEAATLAIARSEAEDEFDGQWSAAGRRAAAAVLRALAAFSDTWTPTELDQLADEIDG